MAKKKTLYYLSTYGQLGNQLATLAHLLAFAIEYDYVIVYPQSDSLSKHIEIAQTKHGRLQLKNFLSNGVFTSGISKLLKLLFLKRNSCLFQYLIINKKFVAENDFNSSKQPDVIIVTDWLFRYYDGIIKHQDALRKLLSFSAASVEQVQKKWLSLQAHYPDHTFIGVHVRRGDYAAWLDGKYFFDNATYYNWLTEMGNQMEKPLFIVCSNEDLQFDNEKNFTIVYVKGSPSEDLFLLSCCKYIIGPPSTFSSWAAFLGDQYLLLMESKDEIAELDQFKKFYLK